MIEKGFVSDSVTCLARHCTQQQYAYAWGWPSFVFSSAVVAIMVVRRHSGMALDASILPLSVRQAVMFQSSSCRHHGILSTASNGGLGCDMCSVGWTTHGKSVKAADDMAPPRLPKIVPRNKYERLYVIAVIIFALVHSWGVWVGLVHAQHMLPAAASSARSSMLRPHCFLGDKSPSWTAHMFELMSCAMLVLTLFSVS